MLLLRWSLRCFWTQALHGKWEDKRELNAQGGRHQQEQVEMGVTEAEKKYVDIFDEGKVVNMDKYLQDQGFDLSKFKTDEDKILFLEEERNTWDVLLIN